MMSSISKAVLLEFHNTTTHTDITEIVGNPKRCTVDFELILNGHKIIILILLFVLVVTILFLDCFPSPGSSGFDLVTKFVPVFEREARVKFS